MSKQHKAQAATIVILVAAFGLAVGRKTSWRPREVNFRVAPRPQANPEDAIYAMLDAAKAGDIKTYLACYTGQMRVSLGQSLAETTEAGFAKYLREYIAAIKGVALSESQPISDRELKVRVEYVYQDRNEVQYMYLEKSAKGWKIARVDSAERVKTLVPYGTPVN